MKALKEPEHHLAIKRGSPSNTVNDSQAVGNHDGINIETTSQTVTGMHSDFGNTIVQSALSGGDSLLESHLHGELASDLAGLESVRGAIRAYKQCSENASWVVTKMKRLPNVDDPRVSRIGQNGGQPLPEPLLNYKPLLGMISNMFEFTNPVPMQNLQKAINAKAFAVGSHIYFGPESLPDPRGGLNYWRMN